MHKYFCRLIAISIFIVSFSAKAALTLPPPTTTTQPTIRQRWYPTVKADTVRTHVKHVLKESHVNGFYHHRYLPHMEGGILGAPLAYALPASIKTLSLKEAIFLALRNNPTVRSSELQRVIDKFNLYIAFQASRLKWSSIDFTSTLQNYAAPQWTLNGGFSVSAPTGTTVSLTHNDNLLGGLGVNEIKVEQQLLQGFGLELGRIPYQNAVDDEQVARLNFKKSVIGVVDSVTTAYYGLVQDYNTLETTIQTYSSQKQAVWEAKLRYKAGQTSESEYESQKTQLESYQLSVVQEKNTLRDDYQSFLKQLGLIPNTQIKVQKKIPKEPIALPTEEACIKLALHNNVEYLQDIFAVRKDKRSLIQARDKRKWKLSMTADVMLGTQRPAVGAPLSSQNTNPTLAFDLSIPIDDVSAKATVVQAQITLQQDEWKLEQEKEDVVRDVMTQYDKIMNQYEQVLIAKRQVKGQERNVADSKLRLKYGKSTVFEVNTYEQSLLSDQVSLISAQITYLTDIESLNNTLGTTLERWHIKLRY